MVLKLIHKEELGNGYLHDLAKKVDTLEQYNIIVLTSASLYYIIKDELHNNAGKYIDPRVFVLLYLTGEQKND